MTKIARRGVPIANRVAHPQRAVSDVLRQRKINEAERQLMQQSESSQSNSQTPEIIPVKMTGSDRKMISPGTKDAPNFSSRRPTELRRFLSRMEDLWESAGVTDDDVKKESVGKYADQDSEEEWRAFENFAKGISWEAFKEELLENYPEAAAAERGTPARLRELCSEYKNIRLGDLPTLYQFRRAFLVEAKKLTKEPRIISNRELVELFIGCLSNPNAQAVLQYLGNMPKSEGKGKEKAAIVVPRRPEDKYDIEDICQAAVQVSTNSQGMFHLTSRGSDTRDREPVMIQSSSEENSSLVAKIESLEASQALEKDRVNAASRHVDAKLGEIENMMKTLVAQTHNATAVPSWRARPNVVKNVDHNFGGGGQQEINCYFCGKTGHYKNDCENLKTYLKAGKLRLSPEGRLCLPDGGPIPNFPAGARWLERVERHYAQKPSQASYCGVVEDDDIFCVNIPEYNRQPQYFNASDDREKRLSQLERDLELRERESALTLRQLKLERAEKEGSKPARGSKAAHLMELMEQMSEEELTPLKNSKSGF